VGLRRKINQGKYRGKDENHREISGDLLRKETINAFRTEGKGRGRTGGGATREDVSGTSSETRAVGRGKKNSCHAR